MVVLESALRKALTDAARFLPQLTRRAEAALIADHQPITGTVIVDDRLAASWSQPQARTFGRALPIRPNGTGSRPAKARRTAASDSGSANTGA
ncbi:hypothetical protein [Actinoplanes sp. NBRC 103695]|uniref:hypothetical protein n=1 Tax=Actinoplanes sp. NBRC 103695 TaxID=3032202 RepID=UPI0025569429|nr:hypothetical protein [Actinoplanes sp. NBRC 103695]